MAIIDQSTAQTRVENEVRHQSDRGFWRDILASIGVVLSGTEGVIDLGGVADSLVLDADGDTTISAPTDDQLDVEVGGTDLATIYGGTHARTAFVSPNHIEPGGAVVMGSDFHEKAFDETNEQWILNSGSDNLAVDPALPVGEGGTAFLDAGDGDGTIAADGSQLVWAIPVQADSGGLTVYARAHIEDITGCSVNIGLTDVTTLEEPFSIATATITSVASNAVCAVFDDGATTKEWFFCGVDGDTDATGNGATGIAPVNGTYQTFRIEIDADGESARLYIDGTLAGTLTAAACAASTNLYLTAVICGDGGNSAAVGLTLDYLYVKHNR